MSYSNYYDIIIAGGGPSGLFTSRLLSELGYSVALFDKEAAIGENIVCSGVISKEAFGRFDLPQNSIIGKLQKATLHSPSHNKINYIHPSESVVVVNRKNFDSELGNSARRSGVNIFANSKVVSLENHNDFVNTKIKSDNEIKVFKSRMAVIATGVSFNLQQCLNMGRPKNILKGIQTEINAPEIDKLNMFWGNKYSKGFFSWAIPLLNGNVKIGVMTRKDPIDCFKYTLKKLGKEDLFNSGEVTFKRRGISFGRIRKNYSDRILAVGESAGLVKTTTGGGIYYGLISGEIASGLIDIAFKQNRFDQKYLSRYQKLIKSNFSKEIKFGEYFHRFYKDLDDYHINKLFDAAKKDDLLSFISEEGSFDWHKNAILKIFRSPNLRNVLLKEFFRQTSSKFAINA